MNNWNIPDALEREIRERDKNCVYCGAALADTGTSTGSRKYLASWEHIINDETIITPENIARCCTPCNSSKGTKPLLEWLESSYCKKKGITKESVADVVKKAIEAQQAARGTGA
jgi:hypothetical protein